MDKELKKLTIDAEKFAHTVVSSHHVENVQILVMPLSYLS
ncbi:hypothetical protein FB550_12068 [Neobacillus bataviensis]|uniref:Uncharacterized protein n=1 Tax=Neobacillus bataviensis TaxID=220685 RepID=A0A561CM71_9BACI|nr:hypothetical protein FB550_12068 [Neobacillus bataviensis]